MNVYRRGKNAEEARKGCGSKGLRSGRAEARKGRGGAEARRGHGKGGDCVKGCGGEEDGRAWKAINGMPGDSQAVWKRVMAGDGQTGQGTAERKPAVAEEAWPGLSETVGRPG